MPSFIARYMQAFGIAAFPIGNLGVEEAIKSSGTTLMNRGIEACRVNLHSLYQLHWTDDLLWLISHGRRAQLTMMVVSLQAIISSCCVHSVHWNRLSGEERES